MASKHLNKFTSQADYETALADGDLWLPNVSWVKDDANGIDKVYYKLDAEAEIKKHGLPTDDGKGGSAKAKFTYLADSVGLILLSADGYLITADRDGE